MTLIIKGERIYFFVIGIIVLVSVSHKAYAQTENRVLSQEELSTHVIGLEKEVQDLKKIIQQQNEIINKLSSKVEEPKTENIAAVKEKPKETEKSPVLAGMGKVDLSMLLQEWYVHDDHAKDNFKHRRLELGLGGKLEDHLLWKVQIDPSLVQEDNTTRSILKDAYVGYDDIPHHVIQLGQYKIPITEEGFRSSAKIDMIERSFIGRTFGDKRDVGLMALGTWKYADYQLGVFNGNIVRAGYISNFTFGYACAAGGIDAETVLKIDQGFSLWEHHRLDNKEDVKAIFDGWKNWHQRYKKNLMNKKIRKNKKNGWTKTPEKNPCKKKDRT